MGCHSMGCHSIVEALHSTCVPEVTQLSVWIGILAVQLRRMLVGHSLGCIPGQQRAPPLGVEADVGGQHHSSSRHEIQDPHRKQPPWRLHTVSVH